MTPTDSDGCSIERIAVVGGGPTAAYFCHALARGSTPCHVTVFEAGAVAGPGTPYTAALNGGELLANIAGIEIPPLSRSINHWAVDQSDEQLDTWGIADSADDDRAFFPRVVLGAWFADEMAALAANAPAHLAIELRTGTQVVDLLAARNGHTVDWVERDGTHGSGCFDRVVIATGYGCVPESDGVIQQVEEAEGAASILVLGSSLSGVDAAVAIASLRGDFSGEGETLVYSTESKWKVTLASRGGVLPEADFWFPMPPEKLDLFHEDRLLAFVRGRDGDLDTVFRLFTSQLARRDPDYAERIGLAELTADSFAEAYFAERHDRDPFDHASINLDEAMRSHRDQRTIPWRYAILLMHEAFAAIVPKLSANDLARFERGLKRVFTDNYAAVPHLSIARLLAMAKAGVLDVVSLGDDYTLERNGDGCWRLSCDSKIAKFDAVLDSRGQRPVGLDDLPFPTLRLQVCANAHARNDVWADGLNPAEDLTLECDEAVLGSIHFAALPLLLKRRPFVQGLVDCAAMADQIASAVSAAVRSEPALPVDQLRDLITQIEQTDLVLTGGAEVIEIASEDLAA